MSWLVSLFSPSSRNANNRRTMMSSRDAFSLPTSSPHPDAFNPDSLNPEPDSAMSPSFSYPPPASGSAYDYVPTSTRSRQSTLLPLHNMPASPFSPGGTYPPLAHTWERLRTWLGREYPELGDTLNWGILPEDLAQIEMQFGFALPGPVRESYLITDGQEPESSAGCSEGLFFGLTLLPLEDVLEEWRFWRDVDEDPATGANGRLRELMQSIPPGWIRKEYSLRGWIPLVSDKGGNYLGVDMNPGEGGAPGQVIVFGRDFDTKVVLWKGDGTAGWAKWLASFVDDLESGEGFEMGVGEVGSDNSEDDLGYESYFYDGSGRGSGDGGGESGTGGMRLSGEYKGWNTLEALADRSLRKWHQEGVMPELPTAAEKGKQKMTLAAFDLSAAGHGSAAEVPIPVLAEIEDSQPALDVVTAEPSDKQPIPTISVTKPPAPLPVDVPTAHDIIPMSDGYGHEADDDLEAGQGMMMQEIDPKLEPIVIQRKASNTTPIEKKVERKEDAILVSIPQETPISNSPEPLSPSSPHQEVDLLSDEEVMLEMPESSSGSEAMDANLDTESKAQKSEEASGTSQEPDNTIRLVGGGGTQGTQEDAVEEDEESDSDLVEVESMHSAASTDSNSKKAGKHEKKKSSISSGLQKLGKMGGKRTKAT